MSKQPAIPGLRDATKKKVTRRELFLSEIDAVADVDRAALSEGGAEGWSATNAAGDDAAGLFPTELV